MDKYVGVNQLGGLGHQPLPPEQVSPAPGGRRAAALSWGWASSPHRPPRPVITPHLPVVTHQPLPLPLSTPVVTHRPFPSARQRRAPSGAQRPALLDAETRRAALTTRFIF